MALKTSGVSGVTGTPRVTMYISPRPILKVPSVAMNGGNRPAVTSRPLVKPKTKPTPSPNDTQTTVGNPFWKASAVTRPDRPITEPTDRSMPPVTITMTMPTDMMAVNENDRKTPIRLSVVRKYGVTSAMPALTSRSASSTLISCARSKPSKTRGSESALQRLGDVDPTSTVSPRGLAAARRDPAGWAAQRMGRACQTHASSNGNEFTEVTM